MDSTIKSMEEIMFSVEIRTILMAIQIMFTEIETPFKAMITELVETVILSLVKEILLWVKEILFLGQRHPNNKSKQSNKWSNKES